MTNTLNKLKKKLRRAYISQTDFSIISDNCWGGFMYQHLGLPYQSPFIGLFIYSPDYIELLCSLEEHLNSKLRFISPKDSKYKKEMIENGTYDKYPIGKIKDVELHFLHYTSENDALEKWNRRIDRINYNNLIIKFCDRDLCTHELINDFHNLRYKCKFSFSSTPTRYANNYNFDTKKNEWKAFKHFTSPTIFLKKHLTRN
ncbi:hypothetical protein DS893_05480 [Vibrionales bacterium C3R12]|nr:hypothetical protein DS893_05480 [Vibrionales bacterium C3R12]